MMPRRAFSTLFRFRRTQTVFAGAVFCLLALAGAPAEPGAPFDPSPPDGAMNVPVSTTLQWNGSSAAEGYNLWLWPSDAAAPAEPTTVGLAAPAYDPSGDLDYATQYRWQVSETYATSETFGPVWNFTTAIEMPHGFAPADKTTGALVDASLSWEASEGASAYDLYFWKLMESKPAAPTATGLTATEWQPPAALDMTTYFWQVVAKNASQKTVGPVLAFTTEEEIAGIADWIEHFYLVVLGRAPEPGAVEAWESGYYDAAVSAGIDVRFVAREMGRLFFLCEEYESRERSDAEFISDCYDAFLLREPNPWELAPWLSDVTTPGGPVRWNRGEVMTMFAESREFEQNVIEGGLFPNLRGDPTRNFVATMYIGVFDRLPDRGGLNYWVGVMAGAKSFDDKLEEAKRMASAFFLSEEGLAKAPTNEARVVRLYRAFLGRFPADGETVFWTGELDCGKKTLESLIEKFGASEEFAATLDAYFRELTVLLPGNVPLVLVRIPAGSFQMGSPSSEKDRASDEGPVHTVHIGYDFYMGKYELTKRQWKAVMGTTPWSGMSHVLSHLDSPAVWVSWDDAQSFLTALNAHIANTGQGPATLRLPSESEWEYACRAGTQTRFYWGDDPSYTQFGDYAWYSNNAWNVGERYAHVVGSKLPNAWGLYDMSGNVCEWCQDWYHSSYFGAPTDGSAWETPTGSYRVLRGGSWFSSARFCRSAAHGSGTPGGWGNNYLGFRVLAVPAAGK